MSFTNSDASTASSDPNDCAHYTFDLTRSWQGTAGDYNSTNTPAAAHDQLIHSEDTELPVRGSDGTWSDNSGLVDIVYETVSTQGTDPTQCNFYTYTISETETATDPCGNEAVYQGNVQYFSDTEPPVYNNGQWTDNSGLVEIVYDTASTQGTDPAQCEFYNYTTTVTQTASDPCGNQATHIEDPQSYSDTEGAYVSSTPFSEGTTIYRPDMSDSPDPTEEEWATFGDNQSPVTRQFTKENVEENDAYTLWQITQHGDDVCLNDPQDYFQYYVNIDKTLGIENKVTPDNAYVYPNPTAGNITMSYNSEGSQDVKGTLYNMQGQQVSNDLYHLAPGENKIPLSLTNLKPGLYHLVLISETRSVFDKVVVLE
jgi:hypothetical protein